MRVLIDTNILVSAALFPNGVPARAYFKAVTEPYHAIVCDYTIDELRRVFNAKFPHRMRDYDQFVANMVSAVEIVTTPPESERVSEEANIRDIDDRPILRAAIASRADMIVTGDKDFLEASILKPRIITAAKFAEL